VTENVATLIRGKSAKHGNLGNSNLLVKYSKPQEKFLKELVPKE
jgi:hypothetical protein